MSRNWRQVRVFSSNADPGSDWYFEILARLVYPWLQPRPDTDYFFSKYSMRYPGDGADTDLPALPAAFRLPVPGGLPFHRSVRIRFVEPILPAVVPAGGGAAVRPTPVESALKNLIEVDPQRFWKSDFLAYDVAGGLGGERFSAFPVNQAVERDRRGELVAAILRDNCRLAMQSFIWAPGALQIEANNHQENQIFGTAFQSVGHMLANVWWNVNGHNADVWAMDPNRGIGTKI